MTSVRLVTRTRAIHWLTISRCSVRSTTIFVRQVLSSSSYLVRQKPAIPVRQAIDPQDQLLPLLTPFDRGRLADLCFAAELCNRRSELTLLQIERLLRLGEIRCLHELPLLSQPGKI